jgi:hypothetical protein
VDLSSSSRIENASLSGHVALKNVISMSHRPDLRLEPTHLPLFDVSFPLSCIAPQIRLLTSSKFSLVSIELSALMSMSPDSLSPPAELLRLRLFDGVAGREAKKPNSSMLWNDSFRGRMLKEFNGGELSSIEDVVGRLVGQCF